MKFSSLMFEQIVKIIIIIMMMIECDNYDGGDDHLQLYCFSNQYDDFGRDRMSTR